MWKISGYIYSLLILKINEQWKNRFGYLPFIYRFSDVIGDVVVTAVFIPTPNEKTSKKTEMLLILWDPLFPTYLIYNSDLGFSIRK